VPKPSSNAGDTFGSGWFALVPAYRLATFRVAIAVITIVFHVPKFNGLIEAYLASAFHVPPAFAWIPPLTRAGGLTLMVLQPVAAAGLLLGVGQRLCGWFLAVGGFYVMALDPEHYSHNAQFHLTLLALVGCSSDRVSLARLLRGSDAGARCPSWPEHLVRLQVCIVLVYTALDKVLSSSWGSSGALLAALPLAPHGSGLAMVEHVNQAVVRAFPAALSLATIGVEFFLAVAFFVRRLWPIGVVTGLVFAVYLEFLVRPGAFTWDMLAALLMFVPAGDRAWAVTHDPACPACRWNRTILSSLDWLRRLRWIELTPALASPARSENVRRGLHLVSPRGREYRGFDALRVLPILLPGPVFVGMAVVRFAGGFLAGRGYGRWDDLPFVMLAGLLALWGPGVARWVGRPLYAAVSAWGSCARSSGWVVSEADGACPAHARPERALHPPTRTV
jgi:Vitamin K-dependent gamma-carboxylase